MILIASQHGLVLIDGALAESAPSIAEGIKTLGYDVHDVKLILTTHVHMDHAGGIAELQKMSGARVLGSPWSAEVLKAGGVAKDDPQYGDIRGIAPVAKVGDGEGWRDGEGGADRGDGALYAGAYGGWGELDVEVVRGRPLLCDGVCR